jgi:hypothetical protein
MFCGSKNGNKKGSENKFDCNIRQWPNMLEVVKHVYAVFP